MTQKLNLLMSSFFTAAGFVTMMVAFMSANLTAFADTQVTSPSKATACACVKPCDGDSNCGDELGTICPGDFFCSACACVNIGGCTCM